MAALQLVASVGLFILLFLANGAAGYFVHLLKPTDFLLRGCYQVRLAHQGVQHVEYPILSAQLLECLEHVVEVQVHLEEIHLRCRARRDQSLRVVQMRKPKRVEYRRCYLRKSRLAVRSLKLRLLPCNLIGSKICRVIVMFNLFDCQRLAKRADRSFFLRFEVTLAREAPILMRVLHVFDQQFIILTINE